MMITRITTTGAAAAPGTTTAAGKDAVQELGKDAFYSCCLRSCATKTL